MNGESGTKTEVIGVDDVSPQVLWTSHFMKAQGWLCNTTVHQDSKSATSQENNCRLSGGNCTKHSNSQCHFFEDAIKCGKVNIMCLSSDEMWSDFFTKPLQGKPLIPFRKNILNS